MPLRAYIALYSALLGSTAAAQPSITGAAVDCVDGEAAGHSCHNVTLLSRLMPDRLEATYVSDMWGWTDSVTGREYALVGTDTAVAFVDISDPVNPLYLGMLPAQDGVTSGWRDIKVYQDHMFVVVDYAGTNGLQIFDLTQLRSPPGIPHQYSQTAQYTQFDWAHNLAINTETGFAYVLGSTAGPCPHAIHIVDIRTPQQPAYAGCYVDVATGIGANGYTHDAQCVIYRGPDEDYLGREICIGSNENGISIADVSDKAQPVKIASAEYPDAEYVHQAWLTEDHRYLFQNDESDEITRHWDSIPPLPGTRTLVWNLEELDDPVLQVEYFGPTGSTDHNLYIVGDTLYMANYTSGLRIVDIASPSAPVEVAHFDTYPFSDHVGFFGAWTAYPFFSSGVIAISSEYHGLYLVAHDAENNTSREDRARPPPRVPAALALSAAYPNPFNPSTVLTLHNAVVQPVTVKAHDLLGRLVAVLHEGTLGAGTHTLRFDGTNHPSGPYLIVATAGTESVTQTVTLAR